MEEPDIAPRNTELEGEGSSPSIKNKEREQNTRRGRLAEKGEEAPSGPRRR